MLLPRVITAVVGVPLILLTVYWGGIPFFVLMLGVTVLALREYFHLSARAKYEAQPVVGTAAGVLLFVSLFLNGTSLGPQSENQGTVALIAVILAAVFVREILIGRPEKAMERLAITFMGVILVSWTLGHLVLLRSIRPAGMRYVYFLFIIIWLIDTGAYAVGRRFGRHPLAEKISPKKTREGAVGGVITGVIVAVLLRMLFLRELLSFGEAAALGLMISVVSQVSDLSESLLKRDAGVKDSANLLPGHGGMLDRFDSFLFTAPLFYYYLTIFKGR
ncbi:MAG: phosphatidate cytidylyltransferase [Endomicrobiales bacterium]